MPAPYTEHIGLEHLYLSYRKAKAEAYYESTHFHALAFAEYERTLERNLRRLLGRLKVREPEWTTDLSFIGGHSYAPKAVDRAPIAEDDAVFYRCLDPLEEWERLWPAGADKPANAEFRLVITPTVDFQIVSALWLLAAGHHFDAVLDPDISFGNRLRRRRPGPENVEGLGAINLDCVGLFPPYFSAYRKWRAEGLKAMRESLKKGLRILAVTMDIRKFYHRASPRFLVRDAYRSRLGIRLTDEELGLTSDLVRALETWYASTPDHDVRPEGAIPVGLSASKVIANVLLAELDRKIQHKVKPLYYGRYVDDIFLVLRWDERIESGTALMERLGSAIPELLHFEPHHEAGPALRLSMGYAEDCDLVFAGSKQKIFNLSGQHGLDLVTHINQQIRQYSSEHRLLAEVPHTGMEMASRSLLAQSSATLEPDALRKADVVSVRRLGLSLLLRDVETYARDLHPNAWRDTRSEFYGLIHRHILTPIGFFDYFGYTHRALGLMVACGDLDEAGQLLLRLGTVIRLLERTTTAGTVNASEFHACRQFYARAFNQIILQATTVVGFRWRRQLLQLFNLLRAIDPAVDAPRRLSTGKEVSRMLLFGDLGRRPYRELWLGGGARTIANPPVPKAISLRRLLRLGAIRAFRKSAELPVPYWPALVFPTRPLSLSEITLAAPTLLQQPHQLRAALFALRGARARSDEGVAVRGVSERKREVEVDGRRERVFHVGVPSYLTPDDEFASAADGFPRLSLARYERIRRLVNRMLQEVPKLHYVVFPECSIPFSWARGIAVKLADRGVSLIAGLEYRVTSKGVRNDAFLSLATQWPWHATSVFLLQPKFAPAHEERRQLRSHGKKRLYRPTGPDCYVPTYIHGSICFSVLICSDLTTIAHRGALQGNIDALFVLEWNKDIETFSSLVEATANDLHAYVIQSNNRRYGDSRIRVPRKRDYERDLVRVRGGLHDYFVVAEVDVGLLRNFQRRTPTASYGPFKPVPIGYEMSERRRDGTT